MKASPVVMLLALSGCAAHSGALRQGDRAARHGSWDVAVARYEQAAELAPHNERVQSRLDAAMASQQADRKRRMDAAVDDLETAVLSHDWEQARAAVGRARAIEPVIADALAEDVWRGLAPDIERRLARGELKQAWPRIMVAVMVYPQDEAYLLFGRVRAAFDDRVDALATRGAWEDAIAWVDWMAEHGVDGDAATRRAELIGDWASSLAAQGKQAEAGGNLARAAVLFHAAYGVDGDRTWLAERERVTRGVEESLRYSVRWPVENGRTAVAVQSEARRQLHADDRLSLDGEARTVATMDLDVGDPVCADEVRETTERKRVKVGTRTVTNPDYAPRMQDLRTAERARSEAERAVQRATDAVGEAERAHQTVLTHTVEPARLADARATEQVTWAQRRVMEAEDALAAALSAVPSMADVPAEVTRLRAERDLAEGRLSDAERAASGPRRALEQAERKLADALRTVETSRRARSSAQRELEGAIARVHTRTDRLDATPLTIEENLYEPFLYPVSTTTRTCTWHATVTHRQDDAIERTVFTHSETVSDSWHAGYVHAGVVEDPFAMPRSDAQLQAAAEQAIADDVVQGVLERSHRYYVGLWDAALRTSSDDVAAALDHWLAVMRLDPTVVDDTGLAALRSRAGDIDWMRR